MLLAAAHRVDATQLILHYLTRFLFKYQCHGRTYTAPSAAGNHLLFSARLTSAQALTGPSAALSEGRNPAGPPLYRCTRTGADPNWATTEKLSRYNVRA